MNKNKNLNKYVDEYFEFENWWMELDQNIDDNDDEYKWEDIHREALEDLYRDLV